MHKKFWLENLMGRDHLKDLGIDGMIILKWVLGKQGVKMVAGCIWLSCKHGNEPLGSINGEEFLN
jgi:hypothetical protein